MTEDRALPGTSGGTTAGIDAKDDAADTAALRTALGSAPSSGEHEGPGAADRALLALFRVYVPGVDVFDGNGYPLAWHKIKHLVREQAGHRCLRCGHPYTKGDGEWSPCDVHCTHGGPFRMREFMAEDRPWLLIDEDHWAKAGEAIIDEGPHGPTIRYEVQARWRILTVHHLDGDKANCRWWNLVSLCQRDHLKIQGVVKMDRPWPWPHTEWFKPYAAAFYAFKYLGKDLSREDTMLVLDELLALGAEEAATERMPL